MRNQLELSPRNCATKCKSQNSAVPLEEVGGLVRAVDGDKGWVGGVDLKWQEAWL